MNFFLSPPFLKTAAVSVIIFIFLDMLWLAIIASPFYLKHFGYLARVENDKIVFNLYAGIFAQAIISLGLSAVITLALNTQNSLLTAIITGAFAGFVIYGTYDFTNMSFVKGYSLLMSLVDVAWGTTQGIFAGIYVYFLSRFFS
ncbi:MAG TPA: DUF2177 family protein [Spirochaetota bacterium]|nr:DUF2177 family protein [Spirochaetota bacterium]OPZ95441.1 MAG: hypothetical protein BWY70_02003 [Bacteroidetes bacterium ADurb.Bin408]HQO39102.1 DUF2177 family protein [Spirochaetota bacterium]